MDAKEKRGRGRQELESLESKAVLKRTLVSITFKKKPFARKRDIIFNSRPIALRMACMPPNLNLKPNTGLQGPITNQPTKPEAGLPRPISSLFQYI